MNSTEISHLSTSVQVCTFKCIKNCLFPNIVQCEQEITAKFQFTLVKSKVVTQLKFRHLKQIYLKIKTRKFPI